MTTDDRGGALRLDGKVCAVTGGASGIGREIATALVRAGGHVVVLDRAGPEAQAAAEALEREGGAASARELDVRDAAAVAECFAAIHDRLGRLDVLVNSAGVREIGDSLTLPVQDWDRVIAINLSGTFYCAQAAGRYMAEAGSGSIINLASVAGLDGAPARAAYCSSKFGIVGLTHTMAYDLGRRGVRVNALCPGLIRTPLTESYFADEGLVAGLPKVIPLGGAGEPRHVADAALFLAGPMSEYVTGVALPVDGGFLAARTFDARIEPGGAFLAANTTAADAV
jgi:NAD(P)-dependent dehydrogenase (short-subunit alcohol dehydrogenase family)